MIRLFIAFGEWLKLNFNVLSGNFISLLSVDIEWHGRNESCWPKWPENINWPSGSIFVQFDWPDRKYTGHGPAVTSTPVIIHSSLSLLPFKEAICVFNHYSHCLIQIDWTTEFLWSIQVSMVTTAIYSQYKTEFASKYPKAYSNKASWG